MAEGEGFVELIDSLLPSSVVPDVWHLSDFPFGVDEQEIAIPSFWFGSTFRRFCWDRDGSGGWLLLEFQSDWHPVKQRGLGDKPTVDRGGDGFSVYPSRILDLFDLGGQFCWISEWVFVM